MMVIAAIALLAIGAHLVLRFGMGMDRPGRDIPLWIALVLGGVPLVVQLAIKAVRGEFGSDLLAGISIVTATILDEHLAGVLVVLMLSGGETLERFAVRRASSVLRALASRMPTIAHRRTDSSVEDVPLSEVRVGDILTLFPHEIVPVDGIVVEGRGSMDESFLTGEPFLMSKAPGAEVISGAINGATPVTIRTTRPAADSRYAKIMRVMRETEENRPKMRRLGDTLGAYYTPLAVAIAAAAWALSGESGRFLAVLVVATPCPLLIGIPVAIIGSISLSARRGIVIKNPVVLEQASTCRTVIFDKTGTLTYGRPRLSDQVLGPGAAGLDAPGVLRLVAALERYSKHPLARAIEAAAGAEGIDPPEATAVSEPPGTGLRGVVEGREIRITSRGALAAGDPPVRGADAVPPHAGGLECFVVIDGAFAAAYRFRDEPRAEGAAFIRHLGPRHRISRVMIVSGDRESEVRYLADQMGIEEVYAEKHPEEKVEIVRAETGRARTIYVGDGINDAPALMAATVGVAIGQHSDITTEAAGAVILDSSLHRVDEFIHISARMRRIALQTAVGGMALSLAGMGFAAAGMLTPVAGAIAQEIIDVLAVLNALRAGVAPKSLIDYDAPASIGNGVAVEAPV
jgi:heavy metal translocating P-type ATPase